MLNTRKYTALAVLGVGLAVAAATPAKAQWFGWGRPYFAYAGWPAAYGYAGFPRLGFGCSCARGYAAYLPRYRIYRPGFAYAAFPRYRFYRPAFAFAGYRPMFRFYRPAFAFAGYRPMSRSYRPVYAAAYAPRFRFVRMARLVW